MSATAAHARLERWVGRPAFWWSAIALLLGGPLVSGLLRAPPAPLPVLDRVPGTGNGRLIVFADPDCPPCLAAASGRLRAIARHLRSVRPGFDLEWVLVGGGAAGGTSGTLEPAVQVTAPSRALPLLGLLERRPEREALRRAERAVLVDGQGRVRGLPDLSAPPARQLLPAITQLVNGR